MTIIDPDTGSLPAIELQDGRLRVRVAKGVTVVALDGGLDAMMAEEVVASLPGALAGVEAVILDVDQVTLLDEDAFACVAAAFEAASADADRCIVASRLSGRMVLERWGVAEDFGVFTSVADALQARTFVASGYGEGWRPGT
jgi:anti-anti-sigma regulatory factor